MWKVYNQPRPFATDAANPFARRFLSSMPFCKCRPNTSFPVLHLKVFVLLLQGSDDRVLVYAHIRYEYKPRDGTSTNKNEFINVPRPIYSQEVAE